METITIVGKNSLFDTEIRLPRHHLTEDVSKCRYISMEPYDHTLVYNRGYHYIQNDDIIPAGPANIEIYYNPMFMIIR